MSLKSHLSHLRSDPNFCANTTAWQTQRERQAKIRDYPESLNPILKNHLVNKGFNYLYEHQYQAFESIKQNSHVVISTSTASGKSMCYNLPVLDYFLMDTTSTFLYLFPTKALSQDQKANFDSLLKGIHRTIQLAVNIYDGDTPQSIRQKIRNSSQIIMTNPDMLHTGILPHHTIWANFLSTLRYIVIDEIHIYRGVFGSNIANVIRRLKRVLNFYNSSPLFIMTSATISNPQELAEKIIEEKVQLIDSDGAPQGERHLIIYNPPLLDEKLGLRKSSLIEATQIVKDLIKKDIQTIIFGRTRKTVELFLTYIRNTLQDMQGNLIRGYRSGYLKDERRQVEEGLRNKSLKAVVTTSALELGIDIGELEVAVLIGYPGSISSARQQIGRAGRKANSSLAIMITTANALDQYLAQHPDYFFERNPEEALIEPNNFLILLNHIRCAAAELPFNINDTFGKLDSNLLKSYLSFLTDCFELHEKNNNFYWIADNYPATSISLRNASPEKFLLIDSTVNSNRIVGQVDKASALWMVHPKAIYIHEGQSYIVENLDLENNTANIHKVSHDYFTEAIQENNIKDFEILKQETESGCNKFYGNLHISSKVKAFRKIGWFSRELISTEELDLPETILDTKGYWFTISEQIINKLNENGLWISPINDYGPDWNKIRLQILERDRYKCQVCGITSIQQKLNVHHIKPFKTHITTEVANNASNLITLCPSCHRNVERKVRIRSSLAGAAYAIGNIAPFLIMCDREDIGVISEQTSILTGGAPVIILFDNIPGGIGLSERLFDRHLELLKNAREIILNCTCSDGCPTCVGPIGEDGYGGKKETIALLDWLIL